jgi:putative ABC transport system substrate-binding protein
MRRREFITLLGGAAATWPLAARAQQPMPVIGYLDVRERSHLMGAFHRGLAETGYVVGQNAAIEFRAAGGQYDRFPELVAEFVQRNVTVIATGITPAALAAKAATRTSDRLRCRQRPGRNGSRRQP